MKDLLKNGRVDNLSGFLLNKIGLLGKRILRSSARGTTNSLSFRNLARLVVIQEGEIQQKRSLPHPGFVVLDSPLLAYFEPEGEEDLQLQGSDLKERFYSYLKMHHHRDSQIIIVENQHPPTSVQEGLAITVFTRNPAEGRFGLL